MKRILIESMRDVSAGGDRLLIGDLSMILTFQGGKVYCIKSYLSLLHWFNV